MGSPVCRFACFISEMSELIRVKFSTRGWANFILIEVWRFLAITLYTVLNYFSELCPSSICYKITTFLIRIFIMQPAFYVFVMHVFVKYVRKDCCLFKQHPMLCYTRSSRLLSWRSSCITSRHLGLSFNYGYGIGRDGVDGTSKGLCRQMCITAFHCSP